MAKKRSSGRKTGRKPKVVTIGQSFRRGHRRTYISKRQPKNSLAHSRNKDFTTYYHGADQYLIPRRNKRLRWEKSRSRRRRR